MSNETGSNPEDTKQENDTAAIAPEILDEIKHPPAINDAMMGLDPQELTNHPAVVPQTLNEPSDLRDDMKRD